MLFVSVLVFLCPPLAAQETTAILFDVHLIGAKIGEISIAGRQSNGQYAARSRFKTTGVVSALKRMHGDVSVNGRVAANWHTPGQYSEVIDDGRRSTNVTVRFGGGVPKLVSGDPDSRAAPADPGRLDGALDPLTALFLILKDQPSSGLCTFRRDIYDGHRHARLSLGNRKPGAESVACSGEYRRIAGYSASDKKEGRVPFRVLYKATAGIMRATRVDIQTKYGKAVLLRR
jgi:hypothetical protein